FWVYGSVCLTYAGVAFGAVLVAWFTWGALRGDTRQLYAGALALGLVGGIRQSVLVLLFPLWLACAINSDLVSRRPMAAAQLAFNSALVSRRPMAAAQFEQRGIRRLGRIGRGLLVLGGAVLTWLLP